MEKIHAMPIRKLLTGVVLTVMTTAFFALTQIASASIIDFNSATVSSDQSKGNVTSDQCAGLDESLAAALGCDTSEKIIDFTKYTGKLDAPDAGGYDSALTTTKSARDLVQTLVNFALGFLGLVATVIVIYGGVLYVTSRGDEDMTSKGKKTITYAVIGILIILSSFAIVNTLIGATGGGNQGAGSGTSQDAISSAGSGFDTASVLNELTSITTEYTKAYNTLLTVTQEVEYLRSIEMPLIVDVAETDVSIGGLVTFVAEKLSGNDQELKDKYQLIDPNDVSNYLDELRQGISRIQRTVDPISDTYEASQVLYNYIRSGSRADAHSNSLANSFIPLAHAAGANGCSTRSYSNSFGGLSKGLGWDIADTSVRNIDDYICPALDEILVAAENDYKNSVDDLIQKNNEIMSLFDTDSQSGSNLNEIRDAISSIDNILTRQAKAQASANTIRNLVDSVNKAYKLVKNIRFVNAVMNVSSVRGNAPLVVRLDALGSTDPSGQTIPDANILWDLDGDGQFNDGVGASISHVYEDADVGTVQVRVKIISTDMNIAAGIAKTTIIVEPRSSAIVITANAGGEKTQIADFRKFPYVSKDSYKVTLSEAKSGIKFDSSQSTGANGEAIEQWEWDFGDNTSLSGGTEASNPTHIYGEAGQYKVSLKITDATRIEDNHLFVIYVDSPAARIEASPANGIVGTSFKLSGGGSTTDTGTIVSYQWSSSEPNSTRFEADTGSNISVEFKSPGVYTLTLLVVDSSGKSDDASIDLLVGSQAPDAKFEYSIPNASEPGTYLFDAKDSSDPDPNDQITYSWDFDGVEGTDYEVINGPNNGQQMNVRFLKKGIREVVLTVCDKHKPELKKCEDAKTKIDINSVLDVKLTIEAGATRQLDSTGKNDVNFQAFSGTASAFEIDYGDGDTEYSDSISNGSHTFTHTYTKAGVFNVQLSALDDTEGRNSQTRRVYISTGEDPIAVISVKSDGEDIGFGNDLSGNVQTKFTFDASESKNIDGTSNNLTYSWNFGDGTTASQKTVSKTFNEHTTYKVTLTVKDKDDVSLSNESSVSVKIQGIDPEIQGITITPIANSLTTPLKVNVSVDAIDKDGKINFVKGWYYDVNDSATQLGTIISQFPNFSLTINTKGEEGQEITYGFAAEVTDNDNRVVNSSDELSESQIPTLKVVNGPNKSPVANFSVDRTSVAVGEELTFSSTSYDPDGKIVEYVWDIEGDGFYNNTPQETASLTYVFKQVYTNGVQVQLKVTDDSGATAVSDPLTIYVDSTALPPDAAFMADVNGFDVQFHDNSKYDTENLAEFKDISWDFDTKNDSDGNGNPSDDTDSTEKDPLFTYDALGTYSVKMIITDSTGQTDSVTRDILVAKANDPVAAFTFGKGSDAKTVKFTNNSKTDTSAGAEVRSYIWDFDLGYDSDGDGNKDNDSDSTEKSPSVTFEQMKTYSVKLTVIDDFGKSDSVIQDVDVQSVTMPLKALIATVPKANTNKQIIMPGTNGDISFFYNAEGGSGDYSYSIDKNIFFDTNGDGIKENDADFTANQSGSWKSGFDKSWGQIVVKITVKDNLTGASAIETVQVVFQGTLAGASLFNATTSEMLLLIVSAMLTTIFGISLVFRYKPIN